LVGLKAPIYGRCRSPPKITIAPAVKREAEEDWGQVSDFISEDDLNTFEGWLKYQVVDPATLTPDELKQWREAFEEGQKNKDSKMGLMKLKARPDEKLYGVAVHDDGKLWLVLWVRRNRKGEFFVMVPRAKSGWDPHNSYHLDGTFHAKSFGHKLEVQQRQPLTGNFRDTEHLGAYGGYGPKTVGAICDPSAFAGVVKVPPGILGPKDGTIVVDLVEPDHEPRCWPFKEVVRQTFKDDVPWIVIRIGSEIPADAIKLELHPIRGKDGAVDLYDMYVTVDRGAPEWIGSRRTEEQCKDAFDAYCRSLPPIYGKGRITTIEIKTPPIKP